MINPPFDTHVPVQYGFGIQLIVPALRVVTTNDCMNKFLCLLGKRFFTNSANKPLRAKKILVIKAVKAVSPAEKSHIRYIILNEFPSLDVCGCLHILTKDPALAILQPGPLRNHPGQH